MLTERDETNVRIPPVSSTEKIANMNAKNWKHTTEAIVLSAQIFYTHAASKSTEQDRNFFLGGGGFSCPFRPSPSFLFLSLPSLVFIFSHLKVAPKSTKTFGEHVYSPSGGEQHLQPRDAFSGL